MAVDNFPLEMTCVRRRSTSYVETESGTAQLAKSSDGKSAARRARKRAPRSKPKPGEGSQKSSRRRASSSLPNRLAVTPEAQAPATSAPALDPHRRVTRDGGRRLASSSADRNPVCAKNPKKPDDIASAKGPSESHSDKRGGVTTETLAPGGGGRRPGRRAPSLPPW